MPRLHLSSASAVQGPLGVLCVVAAVVWLTAPAWGLLTFGGLLLVAAFGETVDARREELVEPDLLVDRPDGY